MDELEPMDEKIANEVESTESEEASGEISEFNEEELLLMASEAEQLLVTENLTESEEILAEAEEAAPVVQLSGTELEDFESGEVEDLEFIDSDLIVSIIESVLFSTDKPQSLATIKQAFKGTSVKSRQIKKAIEELMVEYASSQRGVTLDEVTGGYQLRTKVDNMEYLKRMIKSRPFKVSGPAMEVMSIVAYKQPCIKHELDEIRGVESGHLLRGLMEKGLIAFAGKSELPGKPMLYATTRRFLEVFGLRSLDELPSLSEIDDLIPEGIGAEEEKKETLDQVADNLANNELESSYSQGEEELEKITQTLSDINVSSEFFDQEKQRMKDKRDADRARDLMEALDVGEEIESKDQKWLDRYSKIQEDKAALAQAAEEKEMDLEVISEDLEEISQENRVERGGVVASGENLKELEGQNEANELDQMLEDKTSGEEIRSAKPMTSTVESEVLKAADEMKDLLE